MIWETITAIPLAQLATFVAGGLMLNVAPGQDVFFASACGIQGGPRAGALAGFGVGLGVLMHVTLATVGLFAAIVDLGGLGVRVRAHQADPPHRGRLRAEPAPDLDPLAE